MVSGRWVGGSVVGESVVLTKPLDYLVISETKLDQSLTLR